MNKLTKGAREAFIKVSATLTAVTTVLSLSGVLLVPMASAVAPADYGLKEGETVSAAGSSDPDVYIVNEWGYKRLFLNPVIFGFYGHLGGFAKVKTVSSATRDAFVTSGLFRNCESGDQKVYGVETTGEDVGTFHWINMSGSAAVAEDANFFKKVFCINSNEANWYPKSTTDYTALSKVPVYSRSTTPSASTTPAPSGPLSASLAPGNPAAMTVTTNAQGVEEMRVRFSGTGTVNSLTFKRGGAGSTDDYDNLYVYDGAIRLTSGKSLSSSTGVITFVGLSVAVDGTKDLSLIADLSAVAGNVDYFTLTDVGATGTVGGLPLMSTNMNISGATSGGVTITKVGALGNPNVGQKNAQLSEFKIAANTEAASIKSVTMLNGGTVKATDIKNANLTQGTKSWSGTTTADGHILCDMGSGVSIVKGGNAVFDVWADVGGKSTETIKLYFEEVVDVLAIGDQYGYAMDVTDTAMDTAAEAFAITLQGGTLTLTFNGPNSQNIGTTTDDTVFMNLAMTALTNIEVRKTKWVLCSDTSGNGTYNDANNSSGWGDLTDFKVTDVDSGAAVMGPQDGSTFTTSNTDTCADSATGAQKQFTDVFDLSAGKTRNFKVTADINTSNTGGFQLASGDIVKVALDSYASAVTSSGDLTIMKYTGTNTAVLSTDIVPSADVTSNAFTINSASLTLGLSATPGSQTFIKGTKNVDVTGITFAAGQASELKITDVTLTGYARDETTSSYDEGTDSTDTAVSVANAMTNYRLVEAESGNVVADSTKITNNNLSTQNTGSVKFSFAGTPWLISAGSTKTLLVRVDLSSNTASGTNGDTYSFDISNTANITALDASSTTVNASNQVVNGTLSPIKVLTVKNAGSLKLSAHSSSPTRGSIYWGQQNAPVSKFSINATNQGYFIEKLTIAASVGAEATDAAANVKSVAVTYKNKAGSVLTTTQSFTNGASANFGWTYGNVGTDTRPYVPKDGGMDFDVAANLRTSSEGATQTIYSNNAAGGLVFFSLDISDSYNASYVNGFRAVGDGAGDVIDGTGTNIVDVLGQNGQYVFRAYPKVDQVALPSPYNFTGTPTVFKFSVTAMGLSDSKLRFDNTHYSSGTFRFEVVSSGQVTAGGTGTSTTFSVLDEASVVIDGPTAINKPQSNAGANNYASFDATPAINASINVDFTNNIVEVGGGQTKTFSIRINNPGQNYAKTSSTGRAADYFQVTLQDEADPNGLGTVNWVGNYLGNTTDNGSSSTPGSVTSVIRSLPLYGPTFTR